MTRAAHPRLLAALLTTAVFATGGCASRTAVHGDPVDPERLASIVVGTHTRADVASVLGSPSSAAPFIDDTWYYITSRTEGFGFMADKETERQVVVLRFDPSGVVSQVETLTLANGQEVEMVERTTPSFGENLSILQQFLGNIGRFEKEAPQRR